MTIALRPDQGTEFENKTIQRVEDQQRPADQHMVESTERTTKMERMSWSSINKMAATPTAAMMGPEQTIIMLILIHVILSMFVHSCFRPLRPLAQLEPLGESAVVRQPRPTHLAVQAEPTDAEHRNDYEHGEDVVDQDQQDDSEAYSGGHESIQDPIINR